ncbi:hypothetical protein BDV95DRAFT_351021 [Massariosphaeria phaeospora]|uniref:Oxidoreductase acuF-like C2H2 type zinc-finger domain-containing protein n=1 Tax=Massariosphaeria phaeospora TaxID=100035 RepID=A0A7C8IDN5_9PLEO|nr:hypothetical protein BDV95DRAFT_351021 [Massariosphaeria phaeospora]
MDHDDDVGNLAAQSARCLASFRLLLRSLHDGTLDRNLHGGTVDGEFARFKIWAGSLGALQRGPSSLDVRLRDSAVMRNSILGLLDRLDHTLVQCYQIVSGQRLPLEEQFRVEPDPDGTSDTGSEDSQTSGDSGEATELGQLSQTMKSLVTSLYRLSFKIRNTKTRTTTSKALIHKELDVDTGIDIFLAFEELDRRHVHEHLHQLRSHATLATTSDDQLSERSSESSESDHVPWPCLTEEVVQTLKGTRLEQYSVTTDETLAKRLARSITDRRRHFAYWRRHALKLAQPEQKPTDPRPQELSSNLPTLLPLVTGLSNDQPRVPELPSSRPKTVVSGTEATFFNKEVEDKLDTETVISYATTAYGLDGKKVDLPPEPPEVHSKTEFMCPYCHVMCPSRQGKGKAWRSHVLHDLQPYVCTYPDCLTGEQLYTSRYTWLEHERLAHLRFWQCHEHIGASFLTKEDFRKHLLDTHVDLTTPQAQQLANFSESTHQDERDTCPFCLIQAPFPKGFHQHMAFHQEQISTFALPRNLVLDGTDNESNHSSNAQAGARSEDQNSSDSSGYSDTDIKPRKPKRYKIRDGGPEWAKDPAKWEEGTKEWANKALVGADDAVIAGLQSMLTDHLRTHRGKQPVILRERRRE